VSLAEILVIACAFASGVAVVAALGLYLRDARLKEAAFQRRVGNGVVEPDLAPELLARGAANWMDRSFYMMLERSGSQLSVASAMAILIGSAVVGCVSGLVASAWNSGNWLEHPFVGIAGLLLGAMLPLAWWRWQQARRIKKMQNSLPAALDLLADGLRAGQTLEQGAEMVATRSPSPLRNEFGHTVSLLKLGHSPVAVMERMARRIPLPEFQVFATAVLVHRQTGGNLATLTSRLAAAARDRLEFLSHLGAQTVAGRYSAIGLVIAAVLGVALLMLVRPDYLQFFATHEWGTPLLVTAGVLVLVGAVWMWRVTDVKF
jgi:tight adherence protein B